MLLIRCNPRAILRWFATAIALWIAVPAFAQTTGAIRITVVDPDDLPIPGAEVTLGSDAGVMGGAQVRSADDNGQVVFSALLPGYYSVDATKAEFQGVRATGIQVNIGRETAQTLVLLPGSGTVVEVIVKKAVDVNSTSKGEVLTREFLQRVPAGRSYQQAVQTAAGVTGGGNPSMAGGAYNENTYMLDGATITDPVTGTFSVNFNFDAIAQIEVLLGGYMPEYGTSAGGVLNVVTESGGNNLEFNLSAYYENGQWSPKIDERYTADGFLLAPTGFDQEFQVIGISGLVSGPIVRDKAWLIVSYLGERSLIGFSGVAVPRDYDGNYVLAKATVQPVEEHRFTAFIQMDPTVIDNNTQSVFTRPEAQDRQAQGGFVSQGRWQWFLSPDTSLDTMVVVQKTYIEVATVPCTHDRDLGYSPCAPDEIENSQDWESPGHVGLNGAFDTVNYGIYYFDDRYRYQASTKLSVLSVKDPFEGSHDFKFGVEGVQVVWDQLQGYSSNSLYYDINQTFSDPNSLEGYFWFEITGPITFRTTGSQFNAFAQDSYKPVSNLTINYGSRIDNFVMRNDLGEPVLDGTVFGPRIFAAWDPFKDQKTKVAAGYGRFNDTGTFDVASFTSAASYGSKMFLGENILGAVDGSLNTADYMYDLGPRENTNISAENLRTPQVDELLLSLEREVISDVALFSNVSTKFTRYMYEYDTTNIIYDSDGSTVIGSRNDDPNVPIYRLRTPLLAKRDYVQWDLGIRKVESRRWYSNVTYTYTHSSGSSQVRTSGSFRRDPQTQYNYGPFPSTDLTHVVKATGYWDLPTDPWTQSIGWFFQYASGYPIERLYYAEYEAGGDGGFYNLRIQPRGTYTRYTPSWFLNLQFQQQVNVRKGRLQFSLEIDNITNNQAPSYFNSSSLYTENRLFANGRQQPRSFILGAEYNF